MTRLPTRSLTLLLLALPAAVFAAEPAKKEPTNAAEAAAKQAAEDARLREKFAVWKASLSPERQAWETLLEQNLGSFYLPILCRRL